MDKVVLLLENSKSLHYDSINIYLKNTDSKLMNYINCKKNLNSPVEFLLYQTI